MRFGQEFKCNICKKEPIDNYHRYTCDIVGIDMVFYTCMGECDKKFHSEYIKPFESVSSRWELLDL